MGMIGIAVLRTEGLANDPPLGGFFVFPVFQTAYVISQNFLLVKTELIFHYRLAYYYLTYLKLRVITRYTYGGFLVNGEIADRVGLSIRTFKKHIQIGIQEGWFQVDVHNPEHFYIRSMYSNLYKKDQAIELPDEFVLSLSSKNLVQLKALVTEARIQKLENVKKWLITCGLTNSYYSSKDHQWVKTKRVRKKRNGTNCQKEEPLALVSCKSVGKLIGKSASTAHRYHQYVIDKVEYKRRRVRVDSIIHPDYDIIDQLNQIASSSEDPEKRGKFYYAKGYVWFNGISNRTGFIDLKPIRLRKKRMYTI